MKRLVTYSLVFLLIASNSSCDYIHDKRIRGDGNIVTQSRNIVDFNSVDVSGAIEVIITQDPAFTVKVEIDNNLQPFVEVYKEGEVLHIHQQDNTSLDATRSIKVYVNAPVFKDLGASGACNIKAGNKISSPDMIGVDITGASKVTLDLTAPKIEVGMSGASSATLKGETKDLLIEGSGSSDVDAFELLAENTNVRLSGAGHADVYASVTLEADATGAANIRYKGNPTVNSNTSGAGSVTKGQ